MTWATRLLFCAGMVLALPLSCDSGTSSPKGAGAWECTNLTLKAGSPLATARWLCVEDNGSFWFGNNPSQFTGPAPCTLYNNGSYSCNNNAINGSWGTVGANLTLSTGTSAFQFAGTNTSPCRSVLKRYNGNDVANTGVGGSGGTVGTGGTGGAGGSGRTGGTGGTDNSQATFEMCLARSCSQEQANCTSTAGCAKFLSCFLNCDTSACIMACRASASDAAQAASLIFLQCSLDFCSNDPGPPGCRNTCLFSEDMVCDDGGPNSEDAVCRSGTDCVDCGPR